jgi:MYXO-CTERM domain-containing protein
MENVSRDDWIVGGLALLLVIDLLFLPWFSFASGPVCSIVSCSSTATGAPDGWLGILAVLALVALIVDLGIERLSPQTTLPTVGGSRSQTRLVLAGLAAFFMLLKFLFHIHFSYFGFGFWAGLVLIIALVLATMRSHQGQGIIPSRPAT